MARAGGAAAGIGANRIARALTSDSRKQRRVGLLIDARAWGGMEHHTATLARLLARRGHEVVVAELGEPVFARRREFDGCAGVRLVSAGIEPPLEQVQFRRWFSFLRGLDLDVVVFAKGWIAAANANLDFAARLSGRRFMTIEHTMPPEPMPFRRGRHFGGLVPGLGLYWYRRMGAVYLRSVAPRRIVGVSRAVIGGLREYGFAARKLVAIPNGIDSEVYHRDEESRAAMRAKWRVPADALLFGTVGRLESRQKGQDVAIEQLARLRERHPGRSFRYVLVGDGESRSALEAQTSRLGLDEHVIFAGHTDRPWEVYSAIDVFLLPSSFEGIGLSLQEAMASESCAIAMGVGGVPEVLSDPALGWLTPPGDHDAFLAAMEEVLAMSEEARRAIGARARAHIAQNFRADAQYAKLADLIEGL